MYVDMYMYVACMYACTVRMYMYVVHMYVGSISREKFCEFRGYVAVCEKIIRKYRISYKMWLIQKCNLQNTLMPAIREKLHPRNKPAIQYVHVAHILDTATRSFSTAESAWMRCCRPISCFSSACFSA